MSHKISIKKDDLYDLHINKGKSQTEIAKIFNCDRKTINNYLKRFDIPIKPRLDLPIDEITKYYTKYNMTTQQIANKYNCNRKCIEDRLKNNNVKINNHQKKYTFYYNQSLSDRQKEIIKGSLIGDGAVHRATNGNKNCKFYETHSRKQYEYLNWKFLELKNFIPDNALEKISPKKHNSLSNDYKYRLKTILHHELNYFRDYFYPNNFKIIPNDIEITPLSLAVWYFDDGDIHKNNGRIRLHTEGFDYNSVYNLSNLLNKNFSIENKILEKNAKWNNNKKSLYYIAINKANAKHLIEIVRPFATEDMIYKCKIPE